MIFHQNWEKLEKATKKMCRNGGEVERSNGYVNMTVQRAEEIKCQMWWWSWLNEDVTINVSNKIIWRAIKSECVYRLYTEQ